MKSVVEVGGQPSRRVRAVYGRWHPPESELAALDRLGEVEQVMALIESQLEYMEPDSFLTDEDYDVWRSKAITALGLFRGEQRYIERWLRPPQDHAERIYGCGREVRQLFGKDVAELERRYVRRYSPSALPESRVKIVERLSELRLLRADIDALVARIEARCSDRSLPKKGVFVAKGPLLDLHNAVLEEVRFLRDCERLNVVEIDHRWKRVCHSVLMRAASEGFVVRDDEWEVLDYLAREIS